MTASTIGELPGASDYRFVELQPGCTEMIMPV